MRPVASTGPGAFLRVIHVDGADDEYGHGTAGTAIRTRRPAIARDLRRNPAFAAWRRVFATHHFASAIAVPLLVGGEVYGVLLVYAADPDAFDGTEVGLLEELGPDISHGIAALRAQHERAQAMAELERAQRAGGPARGAHSRALGPQPAADRQPRERAQGRRAPASRDPPRHPSARDRRLRRGAGATPSPASRPCARARLRGVHPEAVRGARAAELRQGRDRRRIDGRAARAAYTSTVAAAQSCAC